MKFEAANLFSQQVCAHLRPLRGEVAILDADLAWFLGIEPAELVEAVERHPARFPEDFVFLLTRDELMEWERDAPCVTGASLLRSKCRLAFTTHGAGMLLAIFTDERFALAAIPVLRAFADYWRQPADTGSPTSRA
jgi:hypothetical protein